jgi:hypothetical protein
VAASAQNLDDFNTWRVIEGRAQLVCTKSPKESRSISSRGIIPQGFLEEEHRRNFQQNGSLNQENLSRRRINNHGSQDKSVKSCRLLDRGEAARSLSLRRGMKGIGHRHSAYQDSRGGDFRVGRNRE